MHGSLVWTEGVVTLVAGRLAPPVIDVGELFAVGAEDIVFVTMVEAALGHAIIRKQ